MKNLRRWLLSRPYALPLAADARLSSTGLGTFTGRTGF
jgi:hypothetical protein